MTARVCEREGCEKKVARQGYTSCSGLCKAITHEMDRAQRACEATGDIDHWLAAVAMNDAVTEFIDSDRRLYLAARAKGVLGEDWNFILNGG